LLCAGTRINAWMSWSNAFKLCGATRRLSTTSGMSRFLSFSMSLSSHPSLTPMPHWLLLSWLPSVLALLELTMMMRRRFTTMSRCHNVFCLSSFPFLVSWRQRGRRELSFLISFFILVYGQENFLCVACKTCYAIFMFRWLSCLSIYLLCLWNERCSYAFVSMLYWCNLVHIHFLPHYLVTWLHLFI
jgi:hypothetical protein